MWFGWEKLVGDAETLICVKRPFHRRCTIAWVDRRDVPGLATLAPARRCLAGSGVVALAGRAQLAVLGRFSDLSPERTGRIRAEHLQVHREERELLEGQR
jgi:hypothetical protein